MGWREGGRKREGEKLDKAAERRAQTSWKTMRIRKTDNMKCCRREEVKEDGRERKCQGVRICEIGREEE